MLCILFDCDILCLEGVVDMEEYDKKGNASVVVIVILIILLVSTVGYICYDKGVFGELVNKEVEKDSSEEKVSEEDVNKLHESLISKSGEFGFYFNRKISVDEIPSNLMLEYAVENYLDDNNITYDDNNYYTVCGDGVWNYYICYEGKKISNDITEKMTIKKEIIDNYIKEKFNTDRNFVYDSVVVRSNNNSLQLFYNIEKKEYYLIVPHRGGEKNEVYSKMLKYEQNKDEIVIYDKAIFCSSGESGKACYTMRYIEFYENDNNNIIFTVNGAGNVYKNNKVLSEGKKYIDSKSSSKNFNADLVFEDFDSELNTFKHVFKKAKDGNYYWYMSDIVK